MEFVTETVIPFAVVFGIPLVAAIFRPTRGTLALLLAAGFTFVTVMLVRDDLQFTKLDDLAWWAIVSGVMAAVVVLGWLAGRAVHRRTRLAHLREA